MDDLTKILAEKIAKSQALLASLHDAQNRLIDQEILQQLNDILDNSVLAALKSRADVRELLATHAKNNQ